MPRLSLHLLFALLSVFLFASPTLAQFGGSIGAGIGAAGVAANNLSGPQVVCNGNGINTGLGCISTNPSEFVTQILQLAVGIGGALGLLLILYGFFIVTTSVGIPDKIKAGQEVISSAVIGLVFLTLSVVMMRFLGVTVFNLPGLR